MPHDRYADAGKAFSRFGPETTEEEIRTAADQLRGAQREQQRSRQWTRVIRALIVVCVFFWERS